MALFLFTGRMKTTLYTNPKGVLMENKEVLEDDVLKKEKINKKEKRVEVDTMSDPPISFLIANDLAACTTDLISRQEGHELNCLALGTNTARWACVVSDIFPPAGGRVMCIGDSINEDGSPKKDWLDVVGERFGQSVFPVSGDTSDNLQGMERQLDMVFFSMCGDYASMGTSMSRWSGLLAKGGVACGPQYDPDQYPATTDAILDVFGAKRIRRGRQLNQTSFWYVVMD